MASPSSKSQELRVAIVGCGQIADGHVSEIQKIAGAEVVAVCDLERLMAEQLAVRYGVASFYDDFTEMLRREQPDVVHIATPPASHLPLALEALAAGCHLLVEKPFTLDYADSVKLVDAAEQAGRKLTISHTYHFDPPAEELRRLVAAGTLGELVHLESFYGYNLNGPFGKVILASPDHWVHRLPGKLFQNNINHLLCKVTEFIPEDRPEIQAWGWCRAEHQFGDVRDQLLDELRVMIRGEKVSAYATFSSHIQPVTQFFRAYGTRNIAHLDFNSRTVTLEPGPTLPAAIGRLAAGFGQAWRYARSAGRNAGAFARSEYHFFAGLNLLFTRFYASIRDGGPPPITPHEILRIAWMMDRIFEQISPPGSGQPDGGAR